MRGVDAVLFWMTISSEIDRQRMKADLRSLDGSLGSYPYSSWKKWVSLSNRISDATLSRLEPINRKENISFIIIILAKLFGSVS